MGEFHSESAIGRPRCEVAKQSIFDAVWRLRSRMPLASISIEAIAREAGVGKATIYRWWPTKAALAMDAFLNRYVPAIGLPNQGSALKRLETQLTNVARAYTGEVAMMVADLLAEGQSDPAVLQLFNEKFVAPRRTLAKQVIEAGMLAGEIDPTIDPDIALDTLFAPIYFRLLVKHAPLDENFVQQLPQIVLRALLPQPAAKAALDSAGA